MYAAFVISTVVEREALTFARFHEILEPFGLTGPQLAATFNALPEAHQEAAGEALARSCADRHGCALLSPPEAA